MFSFLWNGKPWEIWACFSHGHHWLEVNGCSTWQLYEPHALHFASSHPAYFAKLHFRRPVRFLTGVSHLFSPALPCALYINTLRTHTTLGVPRGKQALLPNPPPWRHFGLCRRTHFSGQYCPFIDSMPSVYFYFWSLWGQLCQKGPSLGIQTQCERHRAGGYVHVTLAAGRVHHKRKSKKSTQPSPLPLLHKGYVHYLVLDYSWWFLLVGEAELFVETHTKPFHRNISINWRIWFACVICVYKTNKNC